MEKQLLFLLLILLGVGCEKETEPPVLEPGPYFPVYPGSWWEYIVDDSTFLTDRTSEDYMVHSYKIGGDTERSAETYRVPFLNGQPIYRYDRVEEIGYPMTIYQGIYQRWPVLSDEAGFQFKRSWSDPRLTNPTELVTVKSKVYNGKDSLLYLEGGWVNAYSHGYLLPKKRYQVYIREIGLVSDITVDTVTGDTLSKMILIDYFVNHTFE